jgi:DNA-binding response OmpR family regulator
MIDPELPASFESTVLVPMVATPDDLREIAMGMKYGQPARVLLSPSPGAGELFFPGYPLRVDLEERVVRSKNLVMTPTRNQFAILSILAVNADRVMSRNEILDATHGPGWHGDGRIVDVHRSVLHGRLREELSLFSPPIRNVRGVGFLFSSVPIADNIE